MADEVLNPYFNYPGQSVPTPAAPIVGDFNETPLDNSPPDAPIVTVVAGNGSIDPEADRVCAWWMTKGQSEQWGPMLDAQNTPGGPLYDAHQWSLKNLGMPLFMPSASLLTGSARLSVLGIFSAILAYNNPIVGKKLPAKIGWAVAGLLFPVLTTGTIAIKQAVK